MSEFKVGDMVRLIGPSNIGLVSEFITGSTIAKIDSISPTGNFWCGFTDEKDDSNYTGLYFPKESVGHVRIKNTKIARKINKNNIEKIEKGWIYLNG